MGMGDREPLSWFEGEDPQMQAAIKQAQESFQEFVKAIALEQRRVIPVIEDSLVKYAFPATKMGVKVEHIFLSDIELANGVLSGVINNEPMYTDEVEEGQRIDIDPSRVSDWLYVIQGKGTGGFTFKLMWSRFSRKEKAEYGGHPPFVWIINP